MCRILIAIPTINFIRGMAAAIRFLRILDPKLTEILVIVYDPKLVKASKSRMKRINVNNSLITVIFLARKKGKDLAYKRNIAIVYAKRYNFDFIWLTEDDVIPENKNILDSIRNACALRPAIIVGTETRPPRLRAIDIFLGHFLKSDLINSITSKLTTAYISGFVDRDRNINTFLMPASTLVLSLNALPQIGFFHNAFKGLSEFSEPEFLYRALSKNLRVVKLANFKVLHKTKPGNIIRSIKLIPQRLHNFLLFVFLTKKLKIMWTLYVVLGILLTPFIYSLLLNSYFSKIMHSNEM